MKLNGSCHCKAVTFSLESSHPYPFNLCYCSICRKTAGSGGFGINLSGDYASLQIEGGDNISIYQAIKIDKDTNKEEKSPMQRSFCKRCASTLWCWHPNWPELVHPFASVIDTPLPRPPERTHLMLGSKPEWVIVHEGEHDQFFDEYPDESIADWHTRLNLVS